MYLKILIASYRLKLHEIEKDQKEWIKDFLNLTLLLVYSNNPTNLNEAFLNTALK